MLQEVIFVAFAESTLVGESFVGEGDNAAHINVVLGRKGGPAETAWSTALATPRMGHSPFVVVIRPGVPVLPFTLFANKAAPDSERHGKMTWGPAQAGVAAGVAAAVNGGLIPTDEVRNLLCITAVWVNPDADDEDAVYEHNRSAAHDAIYAAVHETPTAKDVLQYLDSPSNPFYEANR